MSLASFRSFASSKDTSSSSTDAENASAGPGPSTLRKSFRLRPWSLAGSGRRKTGASVEEEQRSAPEHDLEGATEDLEIGDRRTIGREGLSLKGNGVPDIRVRRTSEEGERKEGYEWNLDSDGEEALAVEPDAYSWVDPSFVGTDRLGSSVGF
jgi:hypothetical protein